MTQPYNALYGPPQAPVDNALYYDDTQGMPRQRPADPLRWLADAVGQNKDLPAPQFFMDPRALSVRNMLHSGLGTAANWLDGTKDPSLVGPAEMVSPLGLAGMGMGVANAMTRAGRDFRIADDLARQHPGATPVASVPYGANLRDASNPTSAAHVYDYGLMPGTPRSPVNTNATPYAVMADNAKGSAPGTVLNSLDMSEAARMSRAREQGFDTERPLYHGTKADFDAFRPSEKGKFGSGVYFSPDRQFADEWTSGNGRVIEAYGRGKMADDAAWKAALDAEYKANPSRSMFDVEVAAGQRLQREGFDGVASKARGETVVFDPRNIRSTQAAFDPAKRDSANLLAASPSASAPGLAANSTQQQEGGGFGDFLHRNFVDATVPLSSDENEWAQEIMGSKQLARQDRLRAAGEFGKSAGETVSGWFDYLPQEQARKGIRHLLEKYGTGGPIEPVPQPTQQQDDQGVISILRRYGLAD